MNQLSTTLCPIMCSSSALGVGMLPCQWRQSPIAMRSPPDCMWAGSDKKLP